MAHNTHRHQRTIRELAELNNVSEPIMLPKYTVVTNINCGEYVGTCWEFFRDEGDASLCYQRHKAQGNVPTIRAFHVNDVEHMGAADKERFKA